MPRAVVPAAAPRDRFNLANAVGIAVISLLATMVGTGIVSMISLYAAQARLTDQVKMTSDTLSKHLEHAVDRDDYLRRDAEIQRAIEKMASKEELRDVRQSLDAQTQLLRDLQATLSSPRARR